MKFTSNSPEQTKQIASDFAKKFKGGEVIFLRGELGSGKTTFVQGFAKTFGYDGPVRSPTFTLMNIYPIIHESIKRIVHVDLYRLKNPSELEPLALEEYMDGLTILMIEWPKWLESHLVSDYHEIEFRQEGSNRIIRFKE